MKKRIMSMLLTIIVMISLLPGDMMMAANRVVYFINSGNWESVNVHAWNETGNNGWPGTPITKTGDEINEYDVYSFKEGENENWNNIIFSNNGSSQTSNLTFEAGKYYDLKTAKWYNSLNDVNYLLTNCYLAGDFNSWSTTSHEFKLNELNDTVGYVVMDLNKASYEFKVMDKGVWKGYNNKVFTNSGSEIVYADNGNVTITITESGFYEFSYDVTSCRVSVEPHVNHNYIDGTCTACGAVLEHECLDNDNPKDYKCDVCKKNVCYDADKDSYCDDQNCMKIMEGCVVAKNYTLTLDGKIGVNFYMDIATDVLNDSNANVIFTFNGVDADPIPVKNGAEKDGYRVYTYYVAAKEMADDITAKVVTKDGDEDVVLAECTVSVMKYAKTILKDDNYSNERELVKAMLRYGAYSQTYFKEYNTNNKADSILKELFPDESDPVTEYNISDDYKPDATIPTTKYSATSLILESGVVLRHYFNESVESSKNAENGYYYIDSEQIAAHELNVGKTIMVDSKEITYSPFNYAYTVLNDEKDDSALENLMKAMCDYGDAAREYKAYLDSLNQ